MRQILIAVLLGTFLLVGCGVVDEVNTMTTVTLETNMGDIKIEMASDMPITTGNFVKLVKEGFYDGTRFHRVIGPAKAPPNGFMIQGGDPLSKDLSKSNSWGTGSPGYAIKDEFVPGLSNVRGTLAMANSGPNSGGSQFFINLQDNSFLDYNKPPMQSKHPVFGTVVSGMDVVEKIALVKTDGGDKPLKEVVIVKATVE